MFEINNIVTSARFFLVIAGELVLIFILIAFIVGLLMEYLPPARIRGFFKGRLPWLQYILGSALGAITPFCSCSTVPVLTGLLRSGVPFGPVMAFLFASPVLNPVIIGLFIMLLGYKVTMVYAVVTFGCSMLVALLLSRLGFERHVKPLARGQTHCCDRKDSIDPVASYAVLVESTRNSQVKKSSQGQVSSPQCCQVDSNPPQVVAPFGKKLKRALSAAVTTFKGVFWYLILGAGIGAFIYGFFPQDLVVRLAGPGNPWSIPVAAFLGVPMYIRAETVIPIGAALIRKGMGVGTVLSLVIAGAGASIPEIIILSSIFRRRLVMAFLVSVFIVAIIGGYLVDWVSISPGLLNKA